MSFLARDALPPSQTLPQTRPLLLYLYLCAIVVLYYDHALSLPAEITYIWRRPKTRSALWFLLNRYLTFFATIPVTALNFVQFNHQSCGQYALFRQILLVVQVIVVDLILSLRVYALYGLQRKIIYILAVATAIGLGITGWSISHQDNTRDLEDYSVRGCFLPLSSDSGIHIAAIWEALLAYDLLIFVLILARPIQLGRRHNNEASSNPIIRLVTRDGAMYFVVMALANLANIITFYVGGPFFKGSLSTLATSVSVTLTSRLMLNLHALADRGLYAGAAGAGWTTTGETTTAAATGETLDTVLGNSYAYVSRGYDTTADDVEMAPRH
ncbi:hypothetical protein FB45DRAFT_919155 [Roridomyces roridus]|uniref:DUF6533 domain-containing protein n=1 Tax=Roridomyces roridus TaxID=1738132 RepID=A0AAD7FMV5_9AGAR|nr:hypothetical protein FB45DRAFT_919155 [Roridomyces roridus]